MSGGQGQLLVPGSIVDGRYKVLSHRGISGCADTYEALQLNTDRPVAIRVMDIVLAGSGSTQISGRFAEEVEISTHLSDPGIVTVYDLGVTDAGLPYLVTEPLDGHTLREYLKTHGQVDPVRAIALMRGCARSLAKAHAHGLVHRDLKPDNLYIAAPGTEDERLMILGFGLGALASDEAGHLTHFGITHQAYRYLAPEAITDMRTGPRSDVYQLGLVLVEMLIGEHPFPEDNPYLCCKRHLTATLGVPEVLLASHLGPLLERALAVDEVERYASAGEFGAALEELMCDPHAATVVEVAANAALLARVLPEHVTSVAEWAVAIGSAAARIDEILVHANDDWVVEIVGDAEPEADLDLDALLESSAFVDLSGFIFPAKLDQVLTRDPELHPAPDLPISSSDGLAPVQPPTKGIDTGPGAEVSRDWLATPLRRHGIEDPDHAPMGRTDLPFSGLAYEDYLAERRRRQAEPVVDSPPSRPRVHADVVVHGSRRRSAFPVGLVVAGVVLAIAVLVLFVLLTRVPTG